MPIPALEYRTGPLNAIDTDAIVMALPKFADDQLGDYPGLAAALNAVGFTGAAGTIQRVFVPGVAQVPLAVAGLGTKPNADAVRDAVGAAIRSLTGYSTVAVTIPTNPELWRGAAEGAGLGGYQFDDYKSERGKPRATRVLIYGNDPDDATALADVTADVDAVALVKDLVNAPASALGPEDLARRAREAVADFPVSVDILDEQALRAGGFGGILGVGQGSDRPPRLVRLGYRPEGARRHVALVGKGITFDSGGLSLKPAASMVGMKYDMCGAATVLAVIRALAARSAPVQVTAWLCLADNMPSGRAIRPGDVVTTHNGKTVEVLNTDAEGRLVLADGLAAASSETPDLIVDVATLTGAISIALGNRHVGVMGDDEAVQQYLAAAADVGELAWQLPLPEHMEDELDSPIADLQNVKMGDSAGGSLFAGLFLRRFVGRVSTDDGAARIPWIHLDIAGVGFHKGSGYGFTDKGPTGATVRSLIRFVQTSSN